MNPMESTLHQLNDNKTHLRTDFRCKWTLLSLQGEHFITKIFWIPDGRALQVSLEVVENLLAITLLPITVRTEEVANLLGTLKTLRTLHKRENISSDDLVEYMGKNLGRFSDLSCINILHVLVDLYDI